MKCPTRFHFHIFLHTLLFQHEHILDPKEACNFIHRFSNFEKILNFSLSLKVGYTSLHDVDMVTREEYVYSNNNAKMLGQGGLFYSLY